ncbi:hypothetical protein GGI12_004667, partial [Dipsacomyces acuminosporus]
MVKLTFAVCLLAASLAATTGAHQASDDPQADVKVFTPVLKDKAKFNVYKEPVTVSTPAAPASFVGAARNDNSVKDKVGIATAYLSQKHKIPLESIKITDAYTSTQSGVTHVYFKQIVDGIEVSNGVGNININRQGEVISSSHSFASATAVQKIKRSKITLTTRAYDADSVKKALKSLAAHVKTDISTADIAKVAVSSVSSFASSEPQLSLTNIPKSAAIDGSATAKKAYIQKSDGSLALVWSLVLEQGNHWWSATVNASDGKVESLNDWYSRFESYNVFPKEVNDPLEGSRRLVADPSNSVGSPYGWTRNGTTISNNVWAQNNPTGETTWEHNYRPNAVADNSHGWPTRYVFDFPLNVTRDPMHSIDASITQLFYTVNIMHDLSYLYGFDEAAGNFQDSNYNGKGVGNDAVVAFAQDGGGKNNANFATPPDGQNGRMRMFNWSFTTPRRDSALEQDIVAHEFTHGISNRLTGGPSNTDCLNTLEAGGLGEGWSDIVATMLHIKPNDTRDKDSIMGGYVVGQGIREHPYSTNMTTNPLTFASLNKWEFHEVHAMGEVWAVALYEATWNLIDAYGISPDLFSHDLTKGNALALQLILDGMKLQPCNPTFTQARDALIQADVNLTGGKNKCALWKGFAKRGLGVQATGSDGVT